MIEPKETTNNISLQSPKISMDINKQMEARKKRKESNIDLSNIKKLQPLSLVVVEDVHISGRSFAIVDFDGMGFLLFEQSIDKLPSEKGIDISQRMLLDMYHINPISKVEFANTIQDKDIGAVFLKLHEKIAEVTEKKYGVKVDSTITTLNAMLLLNLIQSENPEAHNMDHCRKLAREVTDEMIVKTVWLALRRREARYMVEREIIAASL
ncbi:MAG: hypothetical protein VYA60_07670 [Pseudomonadota bacterium]|nr:hypothetical protein [Pseudomonadota bacterium]